jgi:hypothetical protein
LTQAEAQTYLQDRADKRYNVIMAVATSALGPMQKTNRYGHSPFLSNNVNLPNPAFFTHVDYVVEQAAARGMIMGLLPCWGRDVNDTGAINTNNAEAYGQFLGARYASKPILWMLGGDRPATAQHLPVWRLMARGIAKGVSGGLEDYSQVMMTYHAADNSGNYHHEPWLDFNALQSGHGEAYAASYNIVSILYNAVPAKPVIDLEPNYEDHPINWNEANGRFTALSVRRQGYWSTFAGACGYTYGATGVFQFYKPGDFSTFGARTFWQDAIAFDGSGDVRHLRELLESRPFASRAPDQSVLASSWLTGANHLRATRATNGSYAMVYSPGGQGFSVNLTRITGGPVKAWWYSPHDGTATNFGVFPNTGTNVFTPPDTNDWVLVLDDAAQNFTVPGQPATLGSLFIRASGDDLVVGWPAGDGSNRLETALVPPGGLPVWGPPGGVTNLAGDLTEVILPADAPARYFRLTRP